MRPATLGPLDASALVRRASTMPVRQARILPVHEALEPLFPERGLQKGTVVATSGVGATSLALTLAAGASLDGGWTAVVGAPWLGCPAALAAGIASDRLVVVPDPSEAWDPVVAALLDAVDVLVMGSVPALRPARARAVANRVRERERVLLTVGNGWPLRPDVTLQGVGAVWEGIGEGHGRLTARRLAIASSGRGAASQTRRTEVWLPGPRSFVEPVTRATSVTPLRRRAAG